MPAPLATLLPRLMPAAPTPVAPRPARDCATARAAIRPELDRLTLSPAAVMAKPGEVRLAPGEDTLTVPVAAGETLWKLATRWGAPGQTAAYVKAIRDANDMSGDLLRAGQALRLPYDPAAAGLPLLVALAIQKDLAARGRLAPSLDLSQLQVGPGPVESYLATAPRRDGSGLQHFSLHDDQTGEDPQRWVVEPIDQKAYERRLNGDLEG